MCKIPGYIMNKGIKHPIYILEFVRCPDGIYGICAQRNPKNVLEQVPKPYMISQIVIDSEWLTEVSEDDTLEKKTTPKSTTKKTLNESTSTKKKKSTTNEEN